MPDKVWDFGVREAYEDGYRVSRQIMGGGSDALFASLHFASRQADPYFMQGFTSGMMRFHSSDKYGDGVWLKFKRIETMEYVVDEISFEVRS